MIETRDAHKELGEFSLRGVDMSVASGEYFVVLGPTGAGKTVLLECIAGLHRLDRGRIHLDGRNVTELAPELRNVGYVPQDYVLFPHLSLRANIEFSLAVRGAPRPSTTHRVQELAQLLGIEHLLDRRPRTLSGGEQQRGALARALAPHPTVLLLDEPLSALDEGTRAELSAELDRIARETGTTVIHVCHSFDEALELADRIAIMHQGRILQVGTPRQVFRQPASEFVARFVGARNLFRVASANSRSNTVVVDGEVALKVAKVPDGSELIASIRPEEISVCPWDGSEDGAGGRGLTNGANAVPCILTRVRDRGRLVHMRLEGSLDLTVTMTRQAFAATRVSEGENVLAVFDDTSVHVLNSGARHSEVECR